MQCGLCCDGTFFGSVVIAPDEAVKLKRVGLRLLQSDSETCMPQPCTALRGCLCSVYAERPSACARYECELRKNVTSGARSLEVALASVSRMHMLLATLRTSLGAGAGVSVWASILALDEPETPEGKTLARATYAEAIAAVGELLELGRAEFEPRFAGGAR